MLPSSSSQLARYGQVNHFKKFWLLQTQLEKQEQSASSSLSLGSSSIPTGVKENSKTSPLVAVSGDDHHAAIAAAAYQYHGACRADMGASGSNCSGRVINGGPTSTFSHCSIEPAGVSSNYLRRLPGYNSTLGPPAECCLRVHGPRLNLAVNCEDVSGVNGYESSESSIEEDKRGCPARILPHVPTTSISVHSMRFHDQLRGVSDYQSSDFPLLHNATPRRSLPASSTAGHLRTCSLCGTTKTPLWRSGPEGPKSLCNACGIRVKKTKRLEAALHATSAPSTSTVSAYKGALKRKLTNETQKNPTNSSKKKRSTSIHISPSMAKRGFSCHEALVKSKSGGPWDSGSPKLAQLSSQSGRGCGHILAEDVEEAAVLLMALSCGLVLS